MICAEYTLHNCIDLEGTKGRFECYGLAIDAQSYKYGKR
jgi:hypothetical protein